jgi:hypothetical protein
MSRQESTLLDAFEVTRSWKATGDTLVLSSEGRPVARFVAVYLR